MSFPGELPSSTREYIHSRAIADDYDDFNFNNALFGLDTRILDDHIPEPGRLIDLGCGTGRHVVHFARRGFQVTGLDISEHMLRICEKKVAEAGLDADILHGDLRDLSGVPDEHFDYATCMFSTLGMVKGRDARRRIAEQVRRILVPGGRFFVHAHNRWHRCYRPDRIVWLVQSAVVSVFTDDEMGDLWMSTYRDIPNMYLHVFSSSELEDLLDYAGFKNVKIVCIDDMREKELKVLRWRDIRSNGFIGIGTK